MKDEQRQADVLDEALEETFPASDPPANTVETGIGIAAEDTGIRVTDNREASRFELEKDGEVAFLRYERRPDTLVLVHTEVPPALRGQGLGTALVKAGLEASRAARLRVVAVCPFVRAYMQKHPD